jgi:hypothetical protein
MNQNERVSAVGEKGRIKSRPRSVRIALGCLIFSICLLSLSIVVSYLHLIPLGAADGRAGSHLATGAFLSLIALKCAAGRNWARWSFLVVTILGLVGLLFTVAAAREALTSQPLAMLSVSLVQLVVQTVTMVLLFSPEASRYFKPAGGTDDRVSRLT